MLYTETTVRDNIRTRDGGRVFYLGSGDRLTAAAKDWLASQRIPILPAHEARPQRYRLPGGGFCESKPEHLTHLHSDLLVPKTHPRIRFRGKMDSLECALLVLGREQPSRQKELKELLSLVRLILKCEVLEEPLPELNLLGLDEEELRKQSHFPQEYYGIPHFMPDFSDNSLILDLNRVRSLARETELAGAEAFRDQEGLPTRKDILQALNRISSTLYILMIREKAKQERERGDGTKH